MPEDAESSQGEGIESKEKETREEQRGRRWREGAAQFASDAPWLYIFGHFCGPRFWPFLGAVVFLL